MIINNDNAEQEILSFLMRNRMSQVTFAEKTGVSTATVKKLVYGEPVKQRQVLFKINAYIHRIEGDR